MEANGFPDSMEEAEVTALRVMVNVRAAYNSILVLYESLYLAL